MPQRLAGDTAVDFCAKTSFCRSDLAFQEYLLRGVDCRSMTKCPGVIVLVARGRWHLESTDVW